MGNTLLELLFPRFCLGCGYVGAYVCGDCEKKMKRAPRAQCFYCEKPSPLGLTHPKCRRKNGVDGYIYIYLYSGFFKEVLLKAKYKGAYMVLKSLIAASHKKTAQNLSKWKTIFKPCVTSIPLHKQRIKERGFNQSDILVDHFFGKMGFVIEGLLEREINTEHLANISDKNKRKKQIRGAFAFVGKNIPKTALLVDDVVTSGATMSECAKTLKKKGVQTVLAFSLAKG